MAAPVQVERSPASPLNDLMCFATYAASRAMNRRYTALLAPWKLTYPQYLVLSLLWSCPSLKVGEIANNLQLDSGTTSPLVRRLEKRGTSRETGSPPTSAS
jgi:DNA-binding MarR family transcriptional regulator